VSREDGRLELFEGRRSRSSPPNRRDPLRSREARAAASSSSAIV